MSAKNTNRLLSVFTSFESFLYSNATIKIANEINEQSNKVLEGIRKWEQTSNDRAHYSEIDSGYLTKIDNFFKNIEQDISKNPNQVASTAGKLLGKLHVSLGHLASKDKQAAQKLEKTLGDVLKMVRTTADLKQEEIKKEKSERRNERRSKVGMITGITGFIISTVLGVNTMIKTFSEKPDDAFRPDTEANVLIPDGTEKSSLYLQQKESEINSSKDAGPKEITSKEEIAVLGANMHSANR